MITCVFFGDGPAGGGGGGITYSRSCKFLVLYTAGEISKQLELLPELTILCEALTIVGIEGKLKSARAEKRKS